MAVADVTKCVSETDMTKNVTETYTTKSETELDVPKNVTETDTTKSVTEKDMAKSETETDTTKSVTETDMAKSETESDMEKSVTETDTTKSLTGTDMTKSVTETYKTKSVTETDVTKSEKGTVVPDRQTKTKICDNQETASTDTIYKRDPDFNLFESETQTEQCISETDIDMMEEGREYKCGTCKDINLELTVHAGSKPHTVTYSCPGHHIKTKSLTVDMCKKQLDSKQRDMEGPSETDFKVENECEETVFVETDPLFTRTDLLYIDTDKMDTDENGFKNEIKRSEVECPGSPLDVKANIKTEPADVDTNLFAAQTQTGEDDTSSKSPYLLSQTPCLTFSPLNTNTDSHFRSQYKGSCYFCYKCSYRGSQKEDVQNHIHEVHDVDTDYHCQFCDFRSTIENPLKIHIKFRHAQDSPYTCPECDFVARKYGGLWSHIQLKHEKSSLLTTKKFGSLNSDTHMSVTGEGNVYKCGTCEDINPELTVHAGSRPDTVTYSCPRCRIKTKSLTVDIFKKHQGSKSRRAMEGTNTKPANTICKVENGCEETVFVETGSHPGSLMDITDKIKLEPVDVDMDLFAAQTQTAEANNYPSSQQHHPTKIKHEVDVTSQTPCFTFNPPNIDTDSLSMENKDESLEVDQFGIFADVGAELRTEPVDVDLSWVAAQTHTNEAVFTVKSQEDNRHTDLSRPAAVSSCTNDGLNNNSLHTDTNSSGRNKSDLKEGMRTLCYKCSRCGFTTENKTYIDTHMSLSHKKEDGLKEIVVTFRYGPTAHTEAGRHNSQEANSCDKCGFITTGEDSLNIYDQRTGRKRTTRSCQRCGYKYCRKSKSQKHAIAGRKGKTYKCHKCQFKTKGKGTLTRHVRTKHGKKKGLPEVDKTTSRTYNCRKCDYETTGKADLKRHVQAALKRTVYKCKKCDLKFCRKLDLRSHVLKDH